MVEALGCLKCRNSHSNDKYHHCTCYLMIVHGVNPSNGSCESSVWFETCSLTSPPTDTTNYLIVCKGHAVSGTETNTSITMVDQTKMAQQQTQKLRLTCPDFL